MFPSIEWKHITGVQNPADIASRGISSNSLCSSSIWWHGPEWLSRDLEHWPSSHPDFSEYALNEQKVMSFSAIAEESYILKFCKRISSWIKLTRIFAYVLRWHPKMKSVKINVNLSSLEIQSAIDHLIKLLQFEQFEQELKMLKRGLIVKKSSSLATLNPFIDEKGLIRVGGRLSNADLDYNSKHPILLKNHYIVKLLIKSIHEKSLHGNISLTLQTLRSSYWIINAKKMIRSVIFNCMVYSKVKADLQRQLMGSLPSQRVLKPSKPFSYCGVDYAGPISVSRRGCPGHIYSDQGTNFKGAKAELNRLFKSLIAYPEIAHFCANDNIQWHFKPPSAPHFGGIWEAGVKRVKYHLKRVLANHTPTFEELCTILCQVEACLNSRPLCALTESCDDLNVLTPGHFLVGGALVSVPQESVLDASINVISRWQMIQQITQRFWKLWTTDYIQSLQSRSKWNVESIVIRIGQIVLVKQENVPPTKWNLGRIIQLHPGIDNVTRVVSVRTATTITKRPVVKLVFLPTFDPIH